MAESIVDASRLGVATSLSAETPRRADELIESANMERNKGKSRSQVKEMLLKVPEFIKKSISSTIGDEDEEEEEEVIQRYQMKHEGYIDGMEGAENTILALRQIIERQSKIIEQLDHELRLKRQGYLDSVKGPHGDEVLDDHMMLTYINTKLDILTEHVLFIARRVTTDRRCRGLCVKHVRTRKCLCQGFDRPHRCCGKIGGICDC
ncbi:uncharacterized protein LOC116621194 [Nematostella vectensis]|uniref:uncharacterized protein LOC116621194 n=1 Tax=Nematostella vectensis TaxID=45351 RepID=UPI002076F341|nr:uncharacterized protein LOC116621194 [Nematostella vectensis]